MEKSNFALFDMVYTRISHDMAGQVGSLSNGTSLLQESIEDKPFRDEAIKLINLSATIISSRLSFFRALCGRPGPLNNDREMKILGDAYLSSLRTGNYAVHARTSGDCYNLPLLKLALALCLIGGDILIKGGLVDIYFKENSIACSLQGAVLNVGQDFLQALRGETDKLTPKNCFCAYLFYLAKENDFLIKSSITEKEMTFLINK